METLSPEENEHAQHLAIIDRKEIEAPPDYVSVYHSTKDEFLPFINDHGLLAATSSRGRLDADKFIDQHRPEDVRNRGISRQSIYAEVPEKGRNYIMGGITLELKVDPLKTYVVESEYIAEANLAVTPEKAESCAEGYWASMITLGEFKKYYEKLPQYTEDYIAEYTEDDEEAEEMRSERSRYWTRVDDAPNDIPYTYHFPEVLIPDDVPSEHIRAVGYKPLNQRRREMLEGYGYDPEDQEAWKKFFD